MGYFSAMDLDRRPCLLDEIAALRGESSWEDVSFPAPPRCATCGTAIAGGIEVDGTLWCIDCVAAMRREETRMDPEGIVDCRVCGKPTRGFGGGICDDCDAEEIDDAMEDLWHRLPNDDADDDPGDGMLGASWSFANPDLAAALDQRLEDKKAQERRWLR